MQAGRGIRAVRKIGLDKRVNEARRMTNVDNRFMMKRHNSKRRRIGSTEPATRLQGAKGSWDGGDGLVISV